MLTVFVQEPKKEKNVPMNTSFPYTLKYTISALQILVVIVNHVTNW